MALYRQANDDYAKMKNISDSNLMNQISRDGKTSIEALNAMLKSSDNINGVTLNDFLGSLGAKDRAIAEANLIKGLMDKNSVNGVVDFRALNESLAKLDFGSEFAKELKGQILSKQAMLNNTSDILNSLGGRVIKSKGMSQGISTDPLKRAETMKANFIIEKLKPLIPRLGNNEALKLHLNRAILNANGDFKLAIKNIENIPDGNLPTPTRNLLNEFKSALKDIEQVVKSQEPTQIAKQEAQTTQNSAQNSIKGDGFITYPNSAKQIYPHNAIFEVPNEIRQIADIGDRVSASLEWLRSNHPEMFKTQRAVKEVIDYVLKEPENIVSPKKGDGVILSKQNDKKMDEIGINQNSEVFHANKRKLNSNEKKAVSGDALPPHLDADNISLTGRYSVGEKSHLTAFDGKTIPNQSIKEAENQSNLAKDPTADAPSELYKAHRKAQLANKPQKASNETGQLRKTEQLQTKEQAQKTSHQKAVDDLIATPKEQWSKEQKEFFDNLPRYKKDQILEIPKIKHDEEVFGKIPYNQLSDRNQMKIIDEAKNSPKGKELQAQYDKLKNAKYTKAEGGKYPSGAQLAKITKAQNKIIAQRDELINSYIKEYDEKVARNSKISSNEVATTKPATKEVEINNAQKPQSNTNSRYENLKKFVEGKTNKALDSEIKIYNDLYRGVLDDFARAHPSELNLPTNYHAETANYITKEFLVKYDKEIKGIITQKASGENRQIALQAFENLKQNFDELRSVGIGDLRKPTAKALKDELALAQIKSMSDKELVTQYQKLYDSNARVNENLFTHLENEIAQREKKLYPFINSDNKDYSYSLEKQLKNRGLMGLKDSDLENIAKERNSRLYLPSYIRQNIQKELNIEPIKEFGTNYAEFYHDGKNAIRKLLAERQGQVAGAFEREELGDIDLVWGEVKTANGDIKGYGLSKIEAKHINDFANFKGDTPQEKLINGISEIIEKGEIKPRSGQDGVNIEYNGFIIGINKGFNGAGDNKWVVTAFDNSVSIAEKKAKTARTDNFTSEVSNLSQNSSANYTPNELLSQGQVPAGWMRGSTNIGNSVKEQPKWADKFKAKMTKMGQEYNDEKIANLANWHKDSHPATKESDGSPKVFYHGTNANFDAFDTNKLANGWLGKSFYFTDTKKKAKGYGKNVMSIYLNIKNPYISKAIDNYGFVREVKEQFNIKENYGEFDPAQVLKEHGYDGVVYKDWNDDIGYIYTAFSPNQIKSIDNKGTFNPRSKMMGGFSTMAMQKAILHLGSGFAGGTINANAEQDPDKKAEAFVKGFLLGAGGSVGAIKTLESSAKLAPQLARISQGIAKDLPGILNDRPDIVGKALGKSPKDNYNYIFGGENAIGANKAKLQTARDMAKNGADESEIWAKTGWYKDIDDKWKFEINPKGGELKENVISSHIAKQNSIEKEISELEKIKDGRGDIQERMAALRKLDEVKKQKSDLEIKLSDILDDKKLFNAYPQLKNIEVVFKDYKGDYGASYGGKIELSKFLEPTMMRSVLYHELQHEIQEIERFASGGGYFSDIAKVEKLIEKYPNDADLQNLYDGLKYDYVSQSAEYNVYRKLAGEAEARNVQTRLTANSKTHPNKTLDINPNERIVKFDSDVSASYTPKQKEVRGVYNVAFNEKRATQIYKDIEDVENVIKFEKGRADNITANKDGFGSLHIQKHLDPKNEGYITTQEYLNMGEYIRKAGDFKESGGKRVYDYTDENGVRFRAIIGDTRGGKDRVISFFSNRKAGSAYDRQNYTRNQPLSENSTPKEIKSQAQKVEQKAKQYAKFLAETNEPTQVAPNELYKAYKKAKKDIEKPTKKDK